eukprot:g48187.t1
MYTRTVCRERILEPCLQHVYDNPLHTVDRNRFSSMYKTKEQKLVIQLIEVCSTIQRDHDRNSCSEPLTLLLIKNLSIAVRETINDLASTAFFRNEFHRFITVWLKKFLLIAVLKDCPFTLSLCPQVLISPPSGNIFSTSTLPKCFCILHQYSAECIDSTGYQEMAKSSGYCKGYGPQQHSGNGTEGFVRPQAKLFQYSYNTDLPDSVENCP